MDNIWNMDNDLETPLDIFNLPRLDYRSTMEEVFGETPNGILDFDMLYNAICKPEPEMPDDILEDISIGDNNDQGQKTEDNVDNNLDPRIIRNDSFWSNCKDDDEVLIPKPEMTPPMPYFGITDQVLGLHNLDEMARVLLPEGQCHPYWKCDDNTGPISSCPSPKNPQTIYIASPQSINSRSLLRSNVNNSENILPKPAMPLRTGCNLSTDNQSNGVFVDYSVFPDRVRFSSDDSDSDVVMKTSGGSYNDRTMVVANDLMTPENSDVDTKIRYTSHDHTYSHPTQEKMDIMVMDKNGSYLTPSETDDDSEIDVESVSTDHHAKSWRQQLDETRQQQTGYHRTAVRTLLPVKKNLKQPKVHEVNKSSANNCRNRNPTTTRPAPYNKPTAKRPSRSKRSDNLTPDQQETRRLRHNLAERQRRHVQRQLLTELTKAVPTMYMPKGRGSQQNVMKGAAECLKDFKLQHELVGFEFAQTTIFDELKDINEIIRRVCNVASR